MITSGGDMTDRLVMDIVVIIPYLVLYGLSFVMTPTEGSWFMNLKKEE